MSNFRVGRKAHPVTSSGEENVCLPSTVKIQFFIEVGMFVRSESN